jgi:hypothetical protein
MSFPTYDAWVPKYKLWDQTGAVLLYTFSAVQDCNVPQNPQETVIVTNLRSSGAVVISGGTKTFDAKINFWLFGNGYGNIISQIDTLYSTIAVNTPYILTVDKSPTTTYSYHVKRVLDFEWVGQNRDWRNYRQEVNLTLLANSW